MILERISTRTSKLGPARLTCQLGGALALAFPLLLALGCGSKPTPPPGAEKETAPLEVDMGSGTESADEAKSELSHGGDKPDSTPKQLATPDIDNPAGDKPSGDDAPDSDK